ncbi:HPr family phosphocarrier protein [Amycolatopsis pithecellobii]|uniref:Phosphocarrier protein HPr n=1 Tax=Amycolatopsis pithecellobii TaxID=664692 RepID=A0A6N7Z928_9PSEU|nr:HPr family phosphocarrier protein [Amycolatopsis pithecellobii]MTD57846.1 HPr family phosphocarrier protein [Amycolatopsis pithecellobii]
MPERRVIVGSKVGLHARPAALFVKAAAAQPVPVTIGVGEGEPVDARSLLSVMGLGARGGDEVVLRADGPEADAALAALATVIAADHDA